MITMARGDLLKADVEAMINPVNCVGVMGRGLALQYRNAFPDNYAAYRQACAGGIVKLGAMFVFDRNGEHHPRWIINFPTKRHWRDSSRIEDIQAGLKDLETALRERGIRTLAMPALGCGLGGLDWAVVRPLIVGTLQANAAVTVHLFAPESVAPR